MRYISSIVITCMFLMGINSSVYSQLTSVNIVSSLQLRHNGSNDFLISDRLLISPHNTVTSIGIGLQAKRMLKYRSKLSIESGLSIYRSTYSFTASEVFVTSNQLEILGFGRTNSSTVSSISFPIRFFYNSNSKNLKSTTGGLYVGPTLNFERLSFNENLNIDSNSRTYIDLNIGLRTTRGRLYFDINIFMNAYTSHNSNVFGSGGLSFAFGYRIK